MKNKKKRTEDINVLMTLAEIFSEEIAGYKAGVETKGLTEREMYGYDSILDAAYNIKKAEETLNGLVKDQKFNSKFKRDFQTLSAKLNAMHADLNNVASGKTKEKKTLVP